MYLVVYLVVSILLFISCIFESSILCAPLVVGYTTSKPLTSTIFTYSH